MVCFSIHGVLKRATSRWWPGNQPTWAYRTIKSMYIIHCLLPEVGRSPQSTKSSSHWISATCQTRPSNNHYQSFECTKLTSNMTCWWERCLKRCSSIPGATPQITRSRQSPRLERRRQLLPDFEVRPFKPSGGASPTSLFSSSFSTSSGEAWVSNFRCKGVWKWLGTLRGRVPCQGDRWLQN